MKNLFIFISLGVLSACALSEPTGYYQDSVVKNNNVEEWKRWEAQKNAEAGLRDIERNRRIAEDIQKRQ
ncbi:hypothetical protein [Acinetobacter rudis]|uniref:Lipoprotein n=1 Tax=Acinetobacter rudis TaxID=632955 RepID=A0AAW8J666_9GAMM|nr:hypothetical protein [Acinetobacter rudis]MDQ8934691.1 hypothetical protein [Acinetobacter rudis]MDQ9017228.1 hypothetical protein [Acinetobacter rudis]